MKTDVYEYHIADIFACPLMYGDCSGLSLKETREFNYWLASEQESIPNFMLWTIADDSETYCTCEVTGLQARCITVHAVFKIEDVE